MRRKGERKLEKTWMPWGPRHSVVRGIETGDSWFYAWLSQACTPLPVIARKTGIDKGRLDDFHYGRALPTGKEIDLLAALWKCPAEEIEASIEMGLAGPLTARFTAAKHPSLTDDVGIPTLDDVGRPGENPDKT